MRKRDIKKNGVAASLIKGWYEPIAYMVLLGKNIENKAVPSNINAQGYEF